MPAKFEKSTLVSLDNQNITTLSAWSGSRGEILLATFDSTLTSVNYSQKHTTFIFDDLYSADLNRDGTPDFILMNRHEKSIACICDVFQDSLETTSVIRLPFEPDRVLVGDYNNDRYLDILVYARKNPGVLPLIGNGKGRFIVGKIIAPDNAVGAADFAHVNNDNLIDIILWDWVKSELHVLYGVGKGRFIDQSVFPVKGEVYDLLTTSVVRGHSLDLILRMTTPSELQVWEGSDFGDFKLKNNIAVDGHITDFSMVDVNNDGLNDAIITTYPASLQVIFNNDVDDFSERIVYASGEDPQNVMISSPYRANLHDCFVFDRNGEKFIVYRNASRSDPMADSIQFATGLSPTEIISNDFNRDGVSDIALVNTKSQSISFYWGQKAAIPFGPLSYSLTGEPARLAFHSSTDTTLQLVLSFPSSHQISYFSFDAANSSISNAYIGSEGDAQLLSASMSRSNQAEFITLNASSQEGNSISFYEQLGVTKFIERTFRLSPPDNLLGASIADFNRDKFPSIVYAYRTGDTSMVELGVAFGDSSYSMKRRIISRELALPNVKHVFIYTVDFDRDSVLDLLMQAGPPVEYLMVAKGKEEGLFLDPKIIVSGLSIEDRSDVQIIDVDKDSLPDIVIGSRKLGRVLWLRNRGSCNFNLDRTLAVEPGLSHYVVTDINGDGRNDLAMTLWKKGILKIINGKRLPLLME